MSGWRAVEPAVVMLPVTQLTVPAALGAADVMAVGAAGVSVAAGLGVELAEHAASTTVAAMARALKRRIPLINSVSPHLLGNRRFHTASRFRPDG
jgi:hypothetical protein